MDWGDGVVVDVIGAFWRNGRLGRVELVDTGVGGAVRIRGGEASAEDALRLARRLDVPVVIREKGVLVALGDMYVADKDGRVLVDAEWREVGGGVYVSESYAEFYESLKPRGMISDAQTVVDSLFWHPAVIYAVAKHEGVIPKPPAAAFATLPAGVVMSESTKTSYINVPVIDAHGIILLSMGKAIDYALLYAKAVLTGTLMSAQAINGARKPGDARKIATETLKELSTVPSFRGLIKGIASRLKAFHGAANTDVLIGLARADEAFGLSRYSIRRVDYLGPGRGARVRYELDAERELVPERVASMLPGAVIARGKIEFETRIRTLLDVMGREAPGNIPL